MLAALNHPHICVFDVGHQDDTDFLVMDRYDVAPDGQRFLVMARDEALSAPVTVTINWLSAFSSQK